MFTQECRKAFYFAKKDLLDLGKNRCVIKRLQGETWTPTEQIV